MCTEPYYARYALWQLADRPRVLLPAMLVSFEAAVYGVGILKLLGFTRLLRHAQLSLLDSVKLQMNTACSAVNKVLKRATLPSSTTLSIAEACEAGRSGYG